MTELQVFKPKGFSGPEMGVPAQQTPVLRRRHMEMLRALRAESQRGRQLSAEAPKHVVERFMDVRADVFVATYLSV